MGALFVWLICGVCRIGRRCARRFKGARFRNGPNPKFYVCLAFSLKCSMDWLSNRDLAFPAAGSFVGVIVIRQSLNSFCGATVALIGAAAVHFWH